MNFVTIQAKVSVASYLKNNIKIHFSIYALELDWSFDYCKTDKSNVHGIGVFATKDIPKNSFITIYPADIIYCNENDTIQYSKRRGNKCYRDIKNSYSASFSDKYTIIGDPEFNTDPNFLGNMINDAVKPIDNDIDNYLKNSEELKNCGIMTSKYIGEAYLSLIISTRDIKESEELFISYDIGYWSINNQLYFFYLKLIIQIKEYNCVHSNNGSK